MEDDSFTTLLKTAQRIIDVNCLEYSPTFLKRRLDIRMRVTGTHSFEEYEEYLKTHPDEKDKLHNEITINVTNFFRDYSMWESFKTNVIPKLLEHKEEGETINIWSAGSSSGDEAYSIIMCFYEVLGEKLSNYSLRLLGTDLDPNIVKKAQEGIYETQTLRETPPEIIEKYFDQEGENYHIKSFIKEHAHFEVGNVLLMDVPKNKDAIFCRNTVIYFDRDSKEKLYARIFAALNDKGYFIMGKTETMLGEARQLFSVIDMKEKIFQKQEKTEV